MKKAGEYLAEKTGVANTLGQGLSSLGSSIGSGATAAGEATAAGTLGAEAGAASAAGAAGAAMPLVGLAIAAIQGNNRNGAKKTGQNMLSQAQQAASQEANNLVNNEIADAEQRLNQIKQNAVAAQAQNVFPNGVMTDSGYPLVENNTDLIGDYQNLLRQQGYADEVINGVPQGLNYGHKNIADWIDQYNAGAGRNNPINKPVTDEEIAAAKAGTFNTPQNAQSVEDVKGNILNKFINGMTDLAKGYQENRTTAFAPENLKPDDSKGKMQRVGEGLGTVARIAQNPAVQGTIAGLAGGALTGNPLYGLGLAQKYAQMRANSNAYQDILGQMGIPVNMGTFGNLSSSDMQHIGNMVETKHRNDVWDEYYKNRIAEQQANLEFKKEQEENKQKQNAIKNEQKNRELGIKQQNANTKANNKNKGGSGKGGGKTAPSGYVIGQTPSGAKVKVPASKVKEFKSMGGKIVG